MQTTEISDARTLWMFLAAALTVGGLAGCSTCPAVEGSSIEQSKQKEIEKLLTSKEWRTAQCKVWNEEKGKTQEIASCDASSNNRRWSFKENGNGSYQENIAGGSEWTEFSWELDGDHLHLEHSGRGSQDFQVITYEDSKLELRHSKACMYSQLRPK
jgi:hypothetical protein